MASTRWVVAAAWDRKNPPPGGGIDIETVVNGQRSDVWEIDAQRLQANDRGEGVQAYAGEHSGPDPIVVAHND
jgi:hypothetical protein